MRTFWQDVQYGLRMLVRRPGFTIVAALSLALGIGANTVIFSLINTTLLRPLPFEDPDTLMIIWTVPAQNKSARNGVNFSAYTTFREKSQTFEAMGALTGISKSLGAEENGAPAERISGWRFAPSVFQVLRVKPALGRFYTEDEDQIDNAAPVIVITHRLWKRHFNNDPSQSSATPEAAACKRNPLRPCTCRTFSRPPAGWGHSSRTAPVCISCFEPQETR